MYKVCIIGAGMIANSAHIPAYRHLPEDFCIAAVCDFAEENAKSCAEKNGIKSWYISAEEMLEKEKPDIVSVCVPNSFHKEYTLLALEHGCHVLCEKPVAFTYADALEMYSKAKEKNVYLIACQSMRFTPDRLAAKQVIENGRIGDIYYSQFARIRRRGIPTWGKFHIKKFSGGGAFTDIGVHMLDAVIWLMGNTQIESVSAHLSKQLAFELGDIKSRGALTGSVSNARPFDPAEMDVEDFASGVINFKNKASVNFSVAWAANAPEETSIRLLGNKGGIDLPRGIMYSGIDTDTPLVINPEKYKDESFSGHFHLIDNILGVLNKTEQLIVKPEETIAVSAIIELAELSSKLGREVRLEELV